MQECLICGVVQGEEVCDRCWEKFWTNLAAAIASGEVKEEWLKTCQRNTRSQRSTELN
jgi:archaellum biogenesis protein FlaJ (TadC family)